MVAIEYYKGSGGDTRRRYINPSQIVEMGAEAGENEITMTTGMSFRLTPESMKKLREAVKAPALKAREKKE
jgi:hypothetical protein